MSQETRIRPPPPPSLPREAPWREIEEIVDGLKAVASKLDTLISLYTGVPVAPPIVTPPIIPAPPELTPITSRLDALLKYANMPLEWGRATGGSKNRLTHLGKSWPNDMWAGYELAIIEGTGAGQIRRINSNDKTSLTPQSDFDTNPDSTTVYVIRTSRAVLVNKSAFTTGQKDVTYGEDNPANHTAEQLPDVEVPDGCQLTILAKPGNTDYIYLGNSKANAESSTNRFDKLEAGLAVSLKITNANKVWIDAGVSGEGISYIVEQVS